MGLTFDVFEDDKDEEGNVIQKDDPKHVLIPEVVREQRMHFFKVPRLGSFLAIRLEYNSCLYVDSYNTGLEDYKSMKGRIAAQEEERMKHDEAEQEKYEDAQANETVYEKQPFNGPKIEPKSFKTQKITFVVCLNTLGQDRTFSEEQKKFALDMVKTYTAEWARIENDNLQSDIERKIGELDSDAQYKELHEAMDLQELENRAADACLPQEGQDPLTEDERIQRTQQVKFELLTK